MKQELFDPQAFVVVVFTNYICTITKQLLRFTDLTMDAISVEVGMDSATYSSRAFHKSEGISPSEYKSSGNATVFLP